MRRALATQCHAERSALAPCTRRIVTLNAVKGLGVRSTRCFGTLSMTVDAITKNHRHTDRWFFDNIRFVLGVVLFLVVSVN